MQVRLRNDASRALRGATAAARTCYAKNLVRPEDIREGFPEQMLPGLWEAGHHTVFQHQHLEFEIEGISRHCVRAFLHNFPFYNTEQQSQRYVDSSQRGIYVPEHLPKAKRERFRTAAQAAFRAYETLTEQLIPIAEAEIRDRGGVPEKETGKRAKRRAMENARYVLPMAARCNLLYTLPWLSLMGLHRSAARSECPEEATVLTQAMTQAFLKQAPGAEFLFQEDPPPPPPEPWTQDVNAWAEAFDRGIPEGRRVRLKNLHWPADIPEEAAQALLDPSRNPALLSAMDLSPYQPEMQRLRRIRLGYLRKISLAADMQNQRHRALTAHRLPLWSCIPENPSPAHLETPRLLSGSPANAYHKALAALLSARQELAKGGFPKEAAYLLPGASRVRYVEEGPLPGWAHRWRLRTCLNAQEEICESAEQELEDFRAELPNTAGFIGPPCAMRNGRIRPRCPEGPRFCGQPVWNHWPALKKR